MTLLSFDASAKSASVCISENNIILSDFTINNGRTHSQDLMRLIDEALKFAMKDVTDLNRILVAKGPGSFTGIRIAMSTAKGLSHALNIPVVGIPTLTGLTYHGKNFKGLICPIMDARRDRVYTSCFKNFGGEILISDSALDIKELCKQILNLDQYKKTDLPILFVGDGLSEYGIKLKELLGERAILGDKSTELANAKGLFYANKLYNFDENTYSEILPIYLRKPQAEREKELLTKK